jgi:hypothetical protein
LAEKKGVNPGFFIIQKKTELPALLIKTGDSIARDIAVKAFFIGAPG